jgi:predicted RNA binding protein YcfA (HicA-like mRNA interferase family)
MGKWKPCKRREFIKKLKKFGFGSPEPGGRHFYMRHKTLTLPNNKEYSIPQIKMLLKEIENGINKKISLEEWENV